MPRIQSLHVYPVKSCRGNDINRMEFDLFGPIGDRRWMVIEASSRKFLSQRSHPELALLRATLSEYRRSSNGALFGQNYINESKSGFVEVGMTVEVEL